MDRLESLRRDQELLGTLHAVGLPAAAAARFAYETGWSVAQVYDRMMRGWLPPASGTAGEDVQGIATRTVLSLDQARWACESLQRMGVPPDGWEGILRAFCASGVGAERGIAALWRVWEAYGGNAASP